MKTKQQPQNKDVFNPALPSGKALVDDIFGADIEDGSAPAAADDGTLAAGLEREIRGEPKEEKPKPEARKDVEPEDDEVDLFGEDEEEEPKKEDVSVEDEEDDDPEFRKLPGQDDAEKTPEEFNEEEFDKTTEAEVKALDPKQAKAWRKLKAELKEARKTALTGSQASRELAEAKKAAEELEQVRIERDGLKERLTRATASSTRAMVEASDEYVSGVERPIAAVAGLVEKIAEDNKADSDSLWAAVTDMDPERRQRKLAELWKGMPDEARADLLGASREYAIALSRRKELFAGADDLVKKTEAQKQAAESERQRKHVDEVRGNMKPLLDSYIRMIPGSVDEDGDETDVARAVRRRALSADISQLDSSDLAYAVVAATMLPEMRKAVREMRSELARLRGKRAAAPKTGDGIETRQKARTSEPEGFLSALKSFGT